MSLLKDQLVKMLVLGNHQAILEEHNTLIIDGEILSISTNDILLDPGYTLITLLASYGLIPKSLFRHQGGKESLRNNVKV